MEQQQPAAEALAGACPILGRGPCRSQGVDKLSSAQGPVFPQPLLPHRPGHSLFPTYLSFPTCKQEQPDYGSQAISAAHQTCCVVSSNSFVSSWRREIAVLLRAWVQGESQTLQLYSEYSRACWNRSIRTSVAVVPCAHCTAFEHGSFRLSLRGGQGGSFLTSGNEKVHRISDPAAESDSDFPILLCRFVVAQCNRKAAVRKWEGCEHMLSGI